MLKLSLAKLDRPLYSAADRLRQEGLDAATYKDYIFGMLFLKRAPTSGRPNMTRFALPKLEVQGRITATLCLRRPDREQPATFISLHGHG